MEINDNISSIASIIGDKARAKILWRLLDGKAYTATELATCANISRQSASNHLAKLLGAQLIKFAQQGRHKYYCLANERVAQAIESLATLIPDKDLKTLQTKPQHQHLLYDRTCYDHLAGELAIKIFQFLKEEHLVQANDRQIIVTDLGQKWFQRFLGIDTRLVSTKKRSFAHHCLDWTERKYHVAGALGNSMLQAMLDKDWIRKKKDSRELLITNLGAGQLQKIFKLS